MSLTRSLQLPSVLLATVVATGLSASDAFAASKETTFALRPAGGQPYFKYDAAGGATLHGRVRVMNVGRKTGTVRLYPADARTGATGGAVYGRSAGGPREVGAWTQLGADRLRLAPHARRTIPFTVRVPDGVRSGDHLGAIVADGGVRRGRVQRRGRARFGVNVRTLVATAIHLTVPGPRTPAMALDGVGVGGAGSYQQIFLKLRNPGNVLVKGRGTLLVRSADGVVTKRNAFDLDTFVPRTSASFPVTVKGKPLPKGAYRATMRLRYKGRTLVRSFGFKVTEKSMRQAFGSPPPAAVPLEPGIEKSGGLPVAWLIGGIAALLLVGLGTAWLYLRRRRSQQASGPEWDDLPEFDDSDEPEPALELAA